MTALSQRDETERRTPIAAGGNSSRSESAFGPDERRELLHEWKRYERPDELGHHAWDYDLLREELE